VISKEDGGLTRELRDQETVAMIENVNRRQEGKRKVGENKLLAASTSRSQLHCGRHVRMRLFRGVAFQSAIMESDYSASLTIFWFWRTMLVIGR
jgi:hypothetical protein